MKRYKLNFTRRNRRAFAAGLLAYVLLAAQFAPLALAAKPRATRTSPSPASDIARERAPEPARAAAAPAPVPAPLAFAPSITATKVDSFADSNGDLKAAAGEVITYTITITNNGADPATGVTFTDTIDSNTTLVSGSVSSQPMTAPDAYNVIGNVRIQVPDGSSDLLGNDVDPDTGNNTGLTITSFGPSTGTETAAGSSGTSAQNGNVTVNSNGSFNYNPAPGFTGTDTFKYTVSDGSKTDTATVTLTISGTIWFVDASASAGGDGRLTSPFNCLAGTSNPGVTTCFSDTAADDPGDNIFLYTGTYTDTVTLTLLNTQRLIGQGASDTLATITGLTVPSHSDALPSTGGTNPLIQTTGAVASMITLGQNNTLRGFTTGDTTGADITGNTFGTLIVGKAGSPDVTVSGTGQALNLTNGTLSVAGSFTSVTTTSSTLRGIFISGVADSDGAGGSAFSFGSTTVSGSTQEGLIVTGSSADINFGNTSVTNGTDGVVLSNNSAGTRTFGTLGISSQSGIGFRHYDPDGATVTQTGGGAVSVTGIVTVTNPTGVGILVDRSNADLSFAATTVNKNATSNIGVNLTNNTGRTISFTSLTSTTTNAFALDVNASGTVTIGAGGSLTQSGAGGGAVSLASTAVTMTFTSVSSNGGGNGIIISGGSGTFASGTTNLQNNAGVGLLMGPSTISANFGNTTVNSSAGIGVNLNSNTGTITFGDLDITPDAGLRGLDAQSNSGTITSTSGDISTSNAAAVFIDGPVARTPLSMVLNNVDATGTFDNGINLTDVSGSFTVNDPGTAVNITNSGGNTGNGINVSNSTAALNFGNTNVSGTGNASSDAAGTGVFITNSTGAVTFADLDIGPDNNERGIHVTNHNTGTITSTSGTITTTGNTAVEIAGSSSGSRAPLNVQLTTVNVTGSSAAINGIFLNNTSATGSPGGFRILGNGGSCTTATPTCTGGRIQQTTGTNGTSGGTNGTGVRLVNANSVFLTLMRLNDHGNNAIYGNNVSIFSLTNSVIDGTNGNNNAGGQEECAIRFDNLLSSGTNSVISNNAISGGASENVRVMNTTGTLDRLLVQNNTFGLISATTGNDNIHMEAHNSGTVAKWTFTDNTFAGTRADFIETHAEVGSTVDTVVRQNKFNDGQATIPGGGTAVSIRGDSLGTSATHTFDISCNRLNANTANSYDTVGMFVAKGNGNGTFSGTVTNNIIGPAKSGSNAHGLFIRAAGGGSLSALVQDNSITGFTNVGIALQNNDGSSTMNVALFGNTVTSSSSSNVQAGVLADNGATSGPPADTNTMNLVIGSFATAPQQNTISTASAPFPIADVVLINFGASTTFNLSRNGSGAGTAAGVVQDDNVGTPSVNTTSGFGSITLVNTMPSTPAAPASCTTPAAPVEIFEEQIGQTDGGQTEAQPAGEETAEVAQSADETQASHESQASQAAEQAAVKAGSQAGYSAARTASLFGAKLTGGRPSARLANSDRPSSAPLTAGIIAEPEQEARPTAIAENTSAATATTAPVVTFAGETVTVNIGTLAAGDSVTITFQVTVANPIPAGVTQVCNQGTVSGTNFSNVLTDDTAVGGAADSTCTPLEVPIDVAIKDGQGPEPPTGTNFMTFSVVLSSPSGGGLTVNYATADGGATPATGGVDCSTPGADYKATSGTLTFASGQRVQSVSVEICSDAVSDDNETFLVNLSVLAGANGGSITDAQAVGTITPNTAGAVLISELRTSGPGGAGDDFVEIYNNSSSPLTIPAGGYGLFKMGATCTDTPVLVGTIPAGTIIPALGHYLFVGSAYSLANYGGSGAAAGNATLTADIENDRNLALFSTAVLADITSLNRLDAVGFGTNTGNNCDLLREATTLTNASGSTSEYSFYRDLTTGRPKDTNTNSADFRIVSTTPTTPVGSNAAPTLGAPGPENLTSPILRTSQINSTLIAPCASTSASPNRVRDTSSYNDTLSSTGTYTLGTLSIRRKFTNNTGGNVTRLRYRLIDVTTSPSPVGTADLRAVTSGDITVTNSCGPTAIKGTTLETPPAQPNGGGLNSTVSSGTITTGTPLAPGASIEVQFLLGVKQSGSFRFFIVVEALP